MKLEVVAVSTENLADVKRYLLEHSLRTPFLLGNLMEFGFKLAKAMYSADFQTLQCEGSIRGVFCLGRSGGLLIKVDSSLQADGSFVDLVVDYVRASEISMRYISSEEETVALLSRRFNHLKYWKEVYDNDSEHVLTFDLEPDRVNAPIKMRPDWRVGLVTLEDWDQYNEMIKQFYHDLGMHLSPEEIRYSIFKNKAKKGKICGVFAGKQLLSTAAINACTQLSGIGVLGMVFTSKAFRRQGLSGYCIRFVHQRMLELGLKTSMLFTDPVKMAPAYHLYTEKFGYKENGSRAFTSGHV